jgi:hypothetical protein
MSIDRSSRWLGWSRCNPHGRHKRVHIFVKHNSDVCDDLSNVCKHIFMCCCRWFLVDRWGRRPILMSGAFVVRGNSSQDTKLEGEFYTDGDCTRSHWMVAVCRRSGYPQSGSNLCHYLQRCIWVQVVPFSESSWDHLTQCCLPAGVPSLGFIRLRYTQTSLRAENILKGNTQIMPLNVRAKGVSLSTATNWAFNFLVGQSTPVLQETITWRLYPMHGFFCVCSFVLVYFCEYSDLAYIRAKLMCK